MAALSRAPCHHRSRRARAAPSLRRVRRVSMTRSTARPTAAPTPTEGRPPKVDSGAAPEGAARTLRAFEGGSRKHAPPSAGRVVGQPGAVPPRCTIVTFLAERRGIPAGRRRVQAPARMLGGSRLGGDARREEGGRRVPTRNGSRGRGWRGGGVRSRIDQPECVARGRWKRQRRRPAAMPCRCRGCHASCLGWGVHLRMYVALGAALWSCRRGTCYATRLSSCVAFVW